MRVVRGDAGCRPVYDGRLRGGLAATYAFAALLVLWGLLYGAYSAFTWEKFTLFDYGVYTNMLWNCGHGKLFHVLGDRSYLTTHLSFSLALLGPFFRLWDDAFLPAVLQWLMLVGGALILVRTMRRAGAAPDIVAAVVLLFVGYPLTQSVMLSEFHGVSAYYLLVPWLHAMLRDRRGFVWLPLLLTLGVREDAFLVALPLVLYFAVRERWRGGYVYGAIAAVYGFLCLTVLYEAINHISLSERRRRDMTPCWTAESLVRRAKVLPWVWLPVTPFLRRQTWLPVLLFPAVPFVTAMASGFGRQFGLEIHYPAPIMACLGAGIAEAVALDAAGVGDRGVPASVSPPRRLSRAALSLVVLTLVAHAAAGFLAGGRRSEFFYRHPSEYGAALHRAGRAVPKRGVLLAPTRLAAFVANRPELVSEAQCRGRSEAFDMVFCDLRNRRTTARREVLDWLETGQGGVRYFDGHAFLIERGFPPSRNGELRRAIVIAAQTMRLVSMKCDGGTNVELPGIPPVRYWEGNRKTNTPTRIAYGATISLDAGCYEAQLYLCARRPRRTVYGDWGRFELRAVGRETLLLDTKLPRIACPPPEFRMQPYRFTLKEPAEVEPVIWGGDAPTWLRALSFAPCPVP